MSRRDAYRSGHTASSLGGSGSCQISVARVQTSRWLNSTIRARQAAQHDHAQASQVIEAQRAEYRAGTTTAWGRTRAAAIAGNHAQRCAWHQRLTLSVQTQRARLLRARFDALPLAEKTRLTHELAVTRTRAGLCEETRRRTWIDTLTPAEYADRRTTRAHTYAQMPPEQQRRHAEAWQAHRERFNLGRGRSHQPYAALVEAAHAA